MARPPVPRKRRSEPMAAADIASSAFPDLPVARTPQAKHHFTTFGQLDSLVATREGDSEVGFMVRMLTLCSLPRTNPGRQLQYIRRNGPYILAMIAGAEERLPYGTLPRLLLAWVCTEAVRTQSPQLHLGRSLDAFMRKLGITSRSGGERGMRVRLRNQMRRLFRCHVQMVETFPEGERSMSSSIAERTEFWWNPAKPDEPSLWESSITLGEGLFREIVEHPVPIDMDVLKAMKRSSLGLDLYLWLSRRTYGMRHPLRLSWKQLYVQFAVHPEKAKDANLVNGFRTKCLRELKKLRAAWPELDYSLPKGSLVLHPVKPLVAERMPPDAH